MAGRKPWCQPDRADTERVLEVVERCPTGALTARRKDGAPTETAPEENRAIVSNDGPVYLTGDLSIEGAPEDMPGVRYRADTWSTIKKRRNKCSNRSGWNKTNKR